MKDGVSQIAAQRNRLPRCCGKEMIVKLDLGKFWEVTCTICKDVVYIKKSEIPKPRLLDD